MNPGLQITVQIFIWIQFGRIRGQKEQFDFVFMLIDPVFDNMTMMNSQIVQNQKHLFVGIFYQSFAKFDKGLRVHCLIVNHETDFTLIGNRRDQVDPFLFCIEPYGRRFSPWRIAPAMLTVAAKPGLIPPIYLSVFFLGPRCNDGILFVKPFLNQFGFCS